MRLIEGTIVHRINRVTRINRAIARARRIRKHLSPSFHIMAPRYGRVLAHDDPRAACRGTGVVTEVIYRAAPLTADRDPREMGGNRPRVA